MKKTITIILIVIILFNLIPTKAYAADAIVDHFKGISVSDEFLENLNNSGKNYGKFLEDLMMFLKDLILYNTINNEDYITLKEYIEKRK